MAHIPIPNGIKVCLRYTQIGQQVCNVFHVRGPSDPTVTDLQTVAEEFAAWWNTELRPLTHAGVTLDAIEVSDMTADGEEGIVYTTGLPLAGTNSGSSLPNHVTIVTKFATGLLGRSFRGRSYMVGLPESALDTGSQTVTSTFRAQLGSAMNDLISSLATAGFNLAIASLFTDGAPRTTGVLTDVLSASVNATVDSQRRRLPERGS